MTDKQLTVVLYGCDRNLWRGGPIRISVSDVFAAGGPRLMHKGTTKAATIEMHLELPFDAGQCYAFAFSSPRHRPAWQFVRRADFIRRPEGVESDDLVLRLMLVPDAPGTRDVSGGFARLQQRGSSMAVPGCGLDEAAFQELDVAAQMALMNIEAKMRDTYVDGSSLLSYVRAVRHVAVDRLFLLVEASLKEHVARSADFAGAPGHRAPDNVAGLPAHPDSWKHQRFAEGNLQLSFSKETVASDFGRAASGPAHSVDVDLDLSKGLAHATEWLENNVFRPGHKTNQALIYAMLYAQGVLPAYTLDAVAATTSRSAVLRPAAPPPRRARSMARRKAVRKTRRRKTRKKGD